MIHNWEYVSNIPQEAVLAHMIMSDENDENSKSSLKGDWGSDGSSAQAVLFKPEELDIYVNKVTNDTYIFHSKKIDYDAIDKFEYNPVDHSVTVHLTSGGTMDLGVKVQWLVRPYFTKADEINVVQTKDGESIDGKMVKLVHKGQDKPE